MHSQHSDKSSKSSPSATRVSLHNPIDWHGGIEKYGFWAVIIEDATWLNAYDHAQCYVNKWVLPGYARRPHITVSASGLIDEAFFSSAKLDAQKSALEELALSAFYIEQVGLDSFEAAPFVSISPNENLSLLRSTLQSIHQDNPAQTYHPHLTLGFYNQDHNWQDLEKHFEDYRALSTPPLLVDKLSYCTYQTHSIQGEISIEFELSLA